jgi:hypothetical protein
MAQPFVAPDGSNLPNALARMQSEDVHVLGDVSRDLANLVPGILRIEVEKDQPGNRYVIWARTQDGRSFSSRVLSDGTLRLLALVALKNDSRHHGVLCFEEPENGVHPFRLKNMVQLLRELATDFADPEQAGAPLRQLLINTHSPVLVSQPGVLSGLLFAYLTTRVFPGDGQQPLRVTKILPVQPSQQLRLALDIQPQEESYTLGEVLEYLDSADFGETQTSLKKDRAR